MAKAKAPKKKAAPAVTEAPASEVAPAAVEYEPAAPAIQVVIAQPEPATEAYDPGPWSRVGLVPLVEGKLYTGFVRGRHIDVLHRSGEFFTDNGGSWSMRAGDVTHVRERPADPS